MQIQVERVCAGNDQFDLPYNLVVLLSEPSICLEPNKDAVCVVSVR